MRCTRRRLLTLLIASTLLAAASCTTPPAAPAAKPAAEIPGPQPQVTWEITPAQGYVDSYGYVRLEYVPPGGAPDLPPGGRLIVHLGRQVLNHANTVWYGFTVTEGPTEILRLDGAEGIPNVKGPDGNWWNDLELDLRQPIQHGIKVTVDDNKIGVTYAFSVRRKVSP
jgi:hypothetical protein